MMRAILDSRLLIISTHRPPGRCGNDFKNVILKLILQIAIMSISWEIAVIWMPLKPLMISQHWIRWWLDAFRQQTITSAKFWPRPMLQYGITRPQWVEKDNSFEDPKELLYFLYWSSLFKRAIMAEKKTWWGTRLIVQYGCHNEFPVWIHVCGSL